MHNNNSSNVNYNQPKLKVIVDNVSYAAKSLTESVNCSNLLESHTTHSVYPLNISKVSSHIINVDFDFPINTENKKETSSDVNELDAVVKEFTEDLKAIHEAGKYAAREVRNFAKREQARVVADFAKIIGIHDKYFKNSPVHQVYELMKKLREIFKIGTNKKTTAFHLLSRQYRDNDTKQASADAKILNYAYDSGKDESTFPAWIIECGGLNKAKEIATQHARDQAEKNDPSSYKLPTPARQKALFRRMEESVAEVAKGQQTLDIFSIKKSKLPDMFGTLKPYAGHHWRVFVVKVEEGVDDEGYGDDELHFHALYSSVPDNARVYKGKRLELSGTSDSTWPEWMLKKPEEPAE